LSKEAQNDVDMLVRKLMDGVLDAGLGKRALKGGFLELRGTHAGRVIVKQTGPASFDIVGKFQAHALGDAANSTVIKKLISGYTP
jgi:hypothetical protein